MNDNACKTLAGRFEDKKAKGLVDIKFYVHQADKASPKQVCDEASVLFQAIEDGAAEDYVFNDRRPAAAGA